ncbi:MAG: hypothetical protein AAGF12_13185 [Myxococcota bacterium]
MSPKHFPQFSDHPLPVLAEASLRRVSGLAVAGVGSRVDAEVLSLARDLADALDDPPLFIVAPAGYRVPERLLEVSSHAMVVSTTADLDGAVRDVPSVWVGVGSVARFRFDGAVLITGSLPKARWEPAPRELAGRFSLRTPRLRPGLGRALADALRCRPKAKVEAKVK